MERWRRIVHPSWLAPATGAIAIGLAVLTLVLDKGEVEHESHLSLYVLTGVIIVAWALEVGGVRWPRLAFMVAVAAAVGALVALGWDLFSPIILIVSVAWAAYSGTRRESVLALGIAITALIPPFFIRQDNREDWISWTIGIVFGWFAMQALAAQQRTLADLRAAQADLARQSAAEERRRIAREVHDVVAHSLAITMLHLTGARHILTRDPRRADEALAQAEQLGRQSLADIRRTVGLLDPERQGGVAAPLPGAQDIADLVAGYAEAGRDARLAITGDPSRLSPTAGLDLYRIAQEALTNAAKHAPGAKVTVAVTIGARAATLRVRDGGPRNGAQPIASAGGSGLGIVGMRERAALLGGSLSAGPDGAGWLVECTIPIRAEC